jgi:hypothetical protein
MRIVDQTRASTAQQICCLRCAPYARSARLSHCRRRLRLGSRQLIAAGACWLLSNTTAVAESLQPSAATTADSDQTSQRHVFAHETRPEFEPKASPGSLGWEIVGGVIPAVAGVALVVASLDAPSQRGTLVPTLDPTVAHTSFGVVMALIGPAIGVAAAGNSTGGTGRTSYTFLGTLGGSCLSVPGVVIGSIFGYRASADDDRNDLRSSLTPVIQRDEISLHWSGVL